MTKLVKKIRANPQRNRHWQRFKQVEWLSPEDWRQIVQVVTRCWVGRGHSNNTLFLTGVCVYGSI